MRIAVLLFSEATIAKLTARGITPEEVRQLTDGDRIVVRNPRPRVKGSVLTIGPTHGGRILTVVLNPEPADRGAWHVGMQDDEITSGELDEVLDEAETLEAAHPEHGTEVRLYVAVDPDTLTELEQQAAARGTDLAEVAADALRAGAHAA